MPLFSAVAPLPHSAVTAFLYLSKDSSPRLMRESKESQGKSRALITNCFSHHLLGQGELSRDSLRSGRW